MTTIRLSAPENEIGPLIERIKAAFPEIVSEKIYDSDREEGVKLAYFNIEEDLQKRAKSNLEDWAIIEYCHELRGTSSIMRYFDLDYDRAKEILDRLVNSGALARELNRKSYSYIDAKKVNWCRNCIYFDKEALECSKHNRYAGNDTWHLPYQCTKYAERNDHELLNLTANIPEIGYHDDKGRLVLPKDEYDRD